MQAYNYRLKVIDPKKKTNLIVHEVHQFHGQFSSVIDLKAKLMEEFQEQVPETVFFNVGYFEGRQSTKKWIYSQEDLETMYKVCAAKSEILLWCNSANATASDEDDCLPAEKIKNKARVQ